MNQFIVRLESVKISNFKNVKNGYLNFMNTRKQYNTSILGLYGQNGSGKTALIECISLLKYAITGKQIPARFADYINVDTEYATITYELHISNDQEEVAYHMIYEINIRKEIDFPDQNIEINTSNDTKLKTVLYNEVLSYSGKCNNKTITKQNLIDTRTQEVFVPQAKYKLLASVKGKSRKEEKENNSNLLFAKKLAMSSSRSFVFSKELLNAIRKNCSDNEILSLYERVIAYGHYELFVIDTINSGLISLDTLPLSFQYKEKNIASIGSIALPLNHAELIPNSAITLVEKIIDSMNIVLTQIVPNLTISLKKHGVESLPNGDDGCKVQLMSNKNNKSIPLNNESEGIKKIISVLQLLIVVYNKSSITVAIDELDSGIFEYLFGELLRIISEQGEGQLIFTSHNLRPLETLDYGFIALTTTDPENRYTRFSNIKPNNNLRDLYYRGIILGDEILDIYDETHNAEIAFAFREAGEYEDA